MLKQTWLLQEITDKFQFTKWAVHQNFTYISYSTQRGIEDPIKHLSHVQS